MKPFLIITLFLSLLLGEKGKAQDSIPQKGEHFYKISLSLIPREMKNKSMGYLVWVTDSMLYYSNERLPFSAVELNDLPVEKISYTVMKSLTLYTVNPSRAVLYPALTLMATGAIIGFAAGDDPPGDLISTTAAEKALVLGTAGFAAGAVIGGIIVAVHHHMYHIKGRLEKYQEFVNFVKNREVRKNE